MEPINIIELIKTVMFLLRKHRSGGYFPEEQMNLVIKAAELAVFNYFRAMYEVNQTVAEHLKPFYVTEALLESNDTGLVPFPDGYAFRGAIAGLFLQNPTDGSTATVIKQYPCYYLDAGEFITIDSDYIAFPDRKKKRFYHTMDAGGFQLKPKEKLWIRASYIRYPSFGSIKYTHTVDGDGNDVIDYDEAASVNMQWDQITFPLFKVLILEYFGVSIKDPYVQQYMNLPKINVV